MLHRGRTPRADLQWWHTPWLAGQEAPPQCNLHANLPSSRSENTLQTTGGMARNWMEQRRVARTWCKDTPGRLGGVLVVTGVGTKKKREVNLALFVPRVGLEPTRPNGHMALNHACLPISAPGQCIKKGAVDTLFICNPSGTRTQDPLIKSEML